MWMVLGLSACSPTKTEIGNLNVIPQPQEVSQDIQAHPFVINPQTGIVYPEGNEKLQRTAEFLASYIKEATFRLSWFHGRRGPPLFSGFLSETNH